jgi:hypothetical protein
MRSRWGRGRQKVDFNLSTLCRLANWVNFRYLAAGILLVIPFIVFLAIPFYNVSTPAVAGLPFYYWWQTLWLALSAGLFVAAAYLIDWGRQEA